MDSLLPEVKRRLAQLYPEEEGWRILELRAPEGFPAPDLLVGRGRHVVLVEVKERGEVTEQDLWRLDRLREAFLAVAAIIYCRDAGQVDAHIRREAERLGIRLIIFSQPAGPGRPPASR